MSTIDTDFCPRTVLSGTGFGAGVTVERVRMGPEVGTGVLLTPVGGTEPDRVRGRVFFPERAQALRDSIAEALA